MITILTIKLQSPKMKMGQICDHGQNSCKSTTRNGNVMCRGRTLSTSYSAISIPIADCSNLCDPIKHVP